VVFAASAFHCANTSTTFAPFEVPSSAVVDLPVRFFFEDSGNSEPTFRAGNIFFLAVGGIGRGE
jgi:hypothetical protein